jgi:hypothetical protein
MPGPDKVSILAFQVGFGDCFLLRLHYPGDTRKHVLIDFGSFPKASWLKDGGMRKVAEAIKAEAGGKLDGVVATHRHADHISGFSTDGEDPGSVIASCAPDVVVQPWTEDPDARTDALQPSAAFMGAFRGDDVRRGQAFSLGRSFVDSLDRLRDLLPVIEQEVARLRGFGSNEMADQLSFFGQNGLSNLSAVQNLIAMGQGGRARFVFHGADSGLEAVLPGVKVRVLGPPTLEQTTTIRKYATTSAEEYWLSLSRTALRLQDEGNRLFPEERAVSPTEAPSYARWLISRLQGLKGRQLLEIVRSLDGVLNNTSVILLFEVGDRKLLFPGDAQLENWTFALEQAGVSDTLKDVNFYKVGHHGSLNATPKTAVWANFRHRGDGLQAALSTLPGVHGGKHGKPTEVPRETLLTALKAESTLFSTEDLPQEAGAFVEIPVGV